MEDSNSRTKPHAVLYIGSLNRGGAERVMVNLAEYLYDAGWMVTFVTTYIYPDEYEVAHAMWEVTKEPGPLGEGGELNTPPEQWQACESKRGIFRLLSGLTEKETSRFRLLNVVRRVGKLTTIFRDLGADVILSFLGKNNVMALECGCTAGIPVVVSVRSNPAREYSDARIRKQMLRLFPKAAAVVLQTQEAVDYFPENVRERAIVLPNSVNPAFLTPNDRGDGIPRIAIHEMSSSEAGVLQTSESGTSAAQYEGDAARDDTSACNRVRKTIISVGRLDENKNQQMLIRAFAQVHEAYPDWSLVLYGDGPSMDDDIALAAGLGIADAVTFTGSVNNIRDRIAQDGIFVLTSRQEGMPNALLEAMALGLPCISTDCKGGGPRDVIRDGENGVLIQVDDEAALKTALQDLIENPERAAALGQAASQDMKALAPEIVNRRWEECLLAAAGDWDKQEYVEIR